MNFEEPYVTRKNVFGLPLLIFPSTNLETVDLYQRGSGISKQLLITNVNDAIPQLNSDSAIYSLVFPYSNEGVLTFDWAIYNLISPRRKDFNELGDPNLKRTYVSGFAEENDIQVNKKIQDTISNENQLRNKFNGLEDYLNADRRELMNS